MTMYDDRTNSVSRWPAISAAFSRSAFSRRSSRATSGSAKRQSGLPAIVYDAKSRGAEAYLALAREFWRATSSPHHRPPLRGAASWLTNASADAA